MIEYRVEWSCQCTVTYKKENGCCTETDVAVIKSALDKADIKFAFKSSFDGANVYISNICCKCDIVYVDLSINSFFWKEIKCKLYEFFLSFKDELETCQADALWDIIDIDGYTSEVKTISNVEVW